MSETVATLDVRELIHSGRDPFSFIMTAVSGLEDGQKLLLVAPFEPEPLYEIMATRGFDYSASPRSNGDWEILFSPRGKRAPGPEKPPACSRSASRR